MKSDVPMTVGAVRRLVTDRVQAIRFAAGLITLIVLPAMSGQAAAQSLYKYRGENGEWIYADRPPDDGSITEVLELDETESEGKITVTSGFLGRTMELTAHNQFHAPVELSLVIESIRGLRFPGPDTELRWVLPARSETVLIGIDLLEDSTTPFLEYRFDYLAGNPGAQHRPPGAYRVPFAIASNYPVTQAYPDVVTHTTTDSHYAVDLAMPVGTDIFAARDGIVFEAASKNFRNGLDPDRDGPTANVVRVLHDDGTYAIYAHLNWNSIRVKPGDRVRRGEYIADSGNTGFSSGPHLHFAVVRNVGMRISSVPVVFKGADQEVVTPATGMALTAY